MLTLLLLIPVSISALYSSHRILRNAQEEIGDFNAHYLKSTAQSVEVMTSSLMKSALHASLSSQLRQLAFLPQTDTISDEEQAVACMRAVNLLGDLVNTNSALSSVYLYIEDSSYVLVSDVGTVARSNLSDLDWLSAYDSCVWMPTRSAVSNAYPFSRGGGEQVVTLLFPLTGYTSNLRGALVFNVREEAFSSLFTAFDVNADSRVSIVSAQGRIISSPDKEQIGQPIDAALLKQVRGAQTDTGYLIQRADGDPTLVSYHRSGFESWIYLGEKSMTALLEKTTRLNLQLIAFNFFFALLALLLAYYVAIRFSSPLNRLIGDIRRRAGAKAQGNDIALLTRTFDSLLGEEARLEGLLEERETDQRRRALCDRLMDRTGQAGDCGLTGFCYVAALQIDEAGAFIQKYRPDQQFYIRNMILTLCTQSALPELRTITTLLDHGQMAVIFSPADDPGRVKTCLSRFQGSVQATLEVSLTIGLSALHTAPQGLGDAFKEAVEASKMRLLCGYGGLFTYFSAPTEKYYYPFLHEKRLLDCLQMNDETSTRAAFSALMQEVGRRPHLSADNALQIVNQLTSSLLRYMADAHYNINRLLPAGENIFLQIGSAETLDDVGRILLPILLQILKLQSGKEAENTDYAEQMLAYIRENYRKDFGIEEMAGSIGLSYSHTRRLFKAEFGRTIVEYVNQFRIDEAKKRLEDPGASVAGIAEQVGYNTEQSFYRFFRKYVGVTPSEYRKKLH